MGGLPGWAVFGMGKLQTVPNEKGQHVGERLLWKSHLSLKILNQKGKWRGEVVKFASALRRKKRGSTKPRLRWEGRWISLTTKAQVAQDKVISR